jgi:DNA polymerase-3 subunit beta
MKFSIEKEDLLVGINATQKAVSSKTTMPILECFHLVAKDNTLYITATDLELGIEYRINTKIEEEGDIIIGANIFSEIIRKLPDSTIELTTNDQNQLVIECEGSLFKIVATISDDFPVFPKINAEQKIKIKQVDLKDMIRKTIFAVGIDESRPIFTGCLLEKKDGMMNMVALDGFRLALQTKVNLEEGTEDFSVVIPGKSLNDISKILGDDDQIVTISVEKNQSLFEIPNCTAVTRVLEGKFLDYRQAIPKEKELRVKVNRNVLLSSLERAAVMSRDEKQLPIKITISDHLMVIECAVQTGNVREEVLIESVGKPLEIGFNPRYLIEAVKTIEDVEIVLDFGSSISPCIIRPIEGEEYIYMVLPVRI